MISKLKSYLPYILSILAILAFIGYLSSNAERYRRLLDLSPLAVTQFLLLVLVGLFLNGMTKYLLYRGMDVPLTLNEGVGLASVNTLANQLPFAGGIIAMGVYLKRRHALTYTDFLSATLALYVCYIAANGVLGLAVLLYLVGQQGTPFSPILFAGLLAMAASIVVLLIPINTEKLPRPIGGRLQKMLVGWRLIKQKKILIAQLILVRMAMTGVFAGRFLIAFHLLSQNVTFAECLLFSSATIITSLVAITPGGLGVREAIVAGVAAILGFQMGDSVIAAGLDRVLSTVVIIGLGVIYTYLLSGKMVKPSVSEPTQQTS